MSRLLKGFDGAIQPFGEQLTFGAAEHVELRRDRTEGDS